MAFSGRIQVVLPIGAMPRSQQAVQYNRFDGVFCLFRLPPMSNLLDGMPNVVEMMLIGGAVVTGDRS